MGKVGHLSKLHDKYFARGLRVVAISSEPLDMLKSKLVTQRSVSFWIGSDPQDRTMHAFTSPGSIGIPQFYLVDAMGKVVGMDMPSEEIIEGLLRQVFVVDLKKRLHQKLGNAQLAYERGSYAMAFKTAGQLLTDKDQTVAADATFVRNKVKGYGQHRRKILEAELKTGQPAQLYGSFLLMKHEFAGVDPELGAWVRKHLKRLAKTPEMKAKGENRAWGLFEKNLKRELRGFKSDYERNRVRTLYLELGQKHPRTVATGFAKNRLKRL
jgi:hypothetical protein